MHKVFDYTNPSLFLRDTWERKKLSNPAFSIRAWAKQLGMKYHSPLHKAVTGQQTLPKKYLPRIISGMKLSVQEGLYLETLIDFHRAKTPQQKELYECRLQELAPKGSVLKVYEVDQYRYLKNPLHTILIELTCLKGFKPDPVWIQGILAMKISQQEIKSAIKLLIHMGLLKENHQSNLIRVQDHLYSKSDVTDLALQEYHQRCSELASQAVTVQPVQAREFSGTSMTIKKSALPLAKRLIRKFREEFIKVIEAAPSEGEELYHLNIQFFGLTHNKVKKGET